MTDQISDDVIAESRIIHYAHKSRAKLHVRDILHHIARDAAMHLHDAPHIAASGDILAQRISLDIYKGCPNHYNSHTAYVSIKKLLSAPSIVPDSRSVRSNIGHVR